MRDGCMQQMIMSLAKERYRAHFQKRTSASMKLTQLIASSEVDTVKGTAFLLCPLLRLLLERDSRVIYVAPDATEKM